MIDKVGDIVERLREQHKVIEDQQAIIEEMRDALKASHVALNDWLNVYASDECDPRRVIEAKERIMGCGTIGYIAEVTEKISGVLAKSDQIK